MKPKIAVLAIGISLLTWAWPGAGLELAWPGDKKDKYDGSVCVKLPHSIGHVEGYQFKGGEITYPNSRCNGPCCGSECNDGSHRNSEKRSTDRKEGGKRGRE